MTLNITIYRNASVFASFQTRSGKYDAEEVEGMIDSILDA